MIKKYFLVNRISMQSFIVKKFRVVGEDSITHVYPENQF